VNKFLTAKDRARGFSPQAQHGLVYNHRVVCGRNHRGNFDMSISEFILTAAAPQHKRQTRAGLYSSNAEIGSGLLKR
jgi:hypothetical protein